MSSKTTHQAAIEALLPQHARVEHARRVQSLQARNAMLTALESAREQQGITKQALAERAGLEPSSVRRLLTSATANPTTDNAFRLMAAMGIALEATLPTGERVPLIASALEQVQAKAATPHPKKSSRARGAKPSRRRAALNAAS